MTPWRLQTKTGLRIIRDVCRVGDTLVIAGQRKGLWGDPILEWENQPLPDGPSVYEYDLTAGPGGDASPISDADAAEINCLALFGDESAPEVWAGGCAAPASSAPKGDTPLDGPGVLWHRDAAGTWTEVALWEPGRAVDSVIQLVPWQGALWLRTLRAVWRRSPDGALSLATPPGTAPLSLYTLQGALCLLTIRDGNTNPRLQTWQRRGGGWAETTDGAPAQGLAWPRQETASAYQPRAFRALGEPHLGCNQSWPNRNQGSVSDFAEAYWPWQLTHERAGGGYQPRTVPLTQAHATFRGHIYRANAGGTLEGRNRWPLIPTTGLSFAWERATNHGERLYVPEAVPRFGARNGAVTVWPWAEDRRLIPALGPDAMPDAYTDYDAVDRYTDSDGLPHYTTATIDALATTYHLTALRRSSGRLYAGVADRLWQDVVPFERLYPWPQFLAAVQTALGSDTKALFTRAHLPFANPSKLWDPALWDGMIPAGGAWEWTYGGAQGALPPPDFADFWRLNLSGAGFDWGDLPPWPSYVIPTDSNRAWLYQLSRFAFCRLIPHGGGYAAASGTDGWAFAWEPTGQLTELFDVGAPLVDLASFGGKLYLAASDAVHVTEGAAGSAVSLTPGTGFSPSALATFGTDLYAVCPGEASTQVWTFDGTDWALLVTLQAVLTRAAVHGSALWLAGEGTALYYIDAGNPTGAAAVAGTWGASETVTALASIDGYLVVGTDQGRTAWTDTEPPSELVWTETEPGTDGYPVAASDAITALGSYDGDLWLGITNGAGAVADFASVALPAGTSYWAAGDEGWRTVYRWTDPWTAGACAPVVIAYDAEAITRLAMEHPTSALGGGPVFWFSEIHCARNPVVALSATHWGATIDGGYTEADAKYWWGAYAPILEGYERNGLDLDTFAALAAAQDAASGREQGAIAPGPLLASFVLARLAEKTPAASVEIWATTRTDSFDLTDYQLVADGRATPLAEPWPFVRFALRFDSGDSTAGLAIFVGTDT